MTVPIITDPAQIPQTGDCVVREPDHLHLIYRPYRDGCPLWSGSGASGLRQATIVFRQSFADQLTATGMLLRGMPTGYLFAPTAQEAVTQYLATLPLGEIRILPFVAGMVWRAVGGSGWACDLCPAQPGFTLRSGYVSSAEWPQVRALLDLIIEWQKNQQADGPIARAIREAK